VFSLVAASQGQDERCHTRHPTTPHDIGLPLRLPTAAWGEPQVAANDALRQAARCYNMTDQNLVLLRRQYLQLFEPDFISWPPPALLRNDDVQTWLFRHLFDPVRNPVLPPAQYQRLVLDNLVRRIVKATGDRSAVQSRLAALFAKLQDHCKDQPNQSLPSQIEAYITFTCLVSPAAPDTEGDHDDPTITLLERRNRVIGSNFTGFRTWEGCMHLATYLLTAAGQEHIRGKRVLELGAGTGFLSILCGQYLGAEQVLATDGDEQVIEALRENVSLNRPRAQDGSETRLVAGGESPISARMLRWGEELEGTWLQEEFSHERYDVVLGADITYDKDAVVLLAFTIKELLQLQPHLEVIIAGVVRKADSFELFLSECKRYGFIITEVDFAAKLMREQKALFYAAAMPLRILSVRGPAVDGA